jgi:hypothetical protein
MPHPLTPPNAPQAIHGKAIDEACEDDRVWFEQNENRQFRLREVVPFEFNGPMDEVPTGFRWRVLIAQASEGIRFRMPVALTVLLPTDGATDENLAKLFSQVAPPKIKKLLKKAKKTKGAKK